MQTGQPFQQRLEGMLGAAPRVSGYFPGLTALAAAIVLRQAILLVSGARSAAIFFNYLTAVLFAGWCGYGPGILGDILPAPLFAMLEPVFRRVLETGEPLLDHELHGPSPTDVADERDWLLGCTPVVTDDGVVLGLQIVVQDITERKRAEKALRRANEDLAQFAYIAAHDLQETRRAAVIFSQLVQRRSRDKLDTESEEYLGHIVEAGQRMCETRIAEAEAHIVHDRLPIVDGDAGRLGQVFQNLLGNALKYRKSEVPPRIEVKASQQNGSWLSAVRDNGQGFSQEYAERIFGIFTRLGREQPGSGIGLAICKTVIERHGGKIWAESGKGQGAIFYFTLPAHRRGGQSGVIYGR